MTTRILAQFIAQIFAVVLLRKSLPEKDRPFRMWLYPVPLVIAFVGWLFVFCTSGKWYILAGVGTLLAGVGMFFLWSRFKPPLRPKRAGL